MSGTGSNDNRGRRAIPTPIASAIINAIADVALALRMHPDDLTVIRNGGRPFCGRSFSGDQMHIVARTLIILCERVDPVRAVERAYAELVAEAALQELIDGRATPGAPPQ